ncbi:MAG: DUF3298 and DUF4163 domain-containing protein [Prevotellaceae bacterium]|nr:DUF3298 and DUF4163 domain-containing protein [Prevotellaceae bacterium]
MKKQIASQIAILLTLSSLFYACGDKSSKGLKLTFDTVMRNETAHLFADTARPACNMVVQLEYITKADNAQTQDSLNNYLLDKALGESYQAMPPREAVAAYMANYVSEYRKDCEPMYTKEMESQDTADTAPDSWYSYYKSIKAGTQFINPYLLVYRIDQEEYTGGAHGMHSGTFINIDLQSLLPLRLNNLFVEEATEPLVELLWNQLITNLGVQSRREAEDMGYVVNGELEPTENFYLDKKGITFYYNVYEIAPYVMGAVEITLPYTAIKPLLKPAIPERFHIEA